MAFKDDLAAHLGQLSAPFLFVGAGLSRRYLGLEDWEGFLRKYAELAGGSYEYYASTADGDYPKMASLIATDLHERWWKDPVFKDSRDYYQGQTGGAQWALKAEISRELASSLDALPRQGPSAEEISRLRSAVVDGVITTNFDPLLEHIFPEFEVFVGQDQMLFAHPQGIGEIYKIHGSYEAPDSLVLTAEDYKTFNERNAYLAAKLLTVFVEHPVIFLGYSLADRNVFAVLRSIASVLTNANIGELQDRLIFIEWVSDPTEAHTLRPIPFMTDGFAIPMQNAKVADYLDLFEVLGGLERRFPAPVLRQLKERVYELVQTNDPKGKLFVQDLEPDIDATEVDVVLGVGAIEKQLLRSYKGLDRNQLAEDVLGGKSELDPRRVLTEVLPSIGRHIHVPVFKYLREAGLLEDDGVLRDKASVDKRVAFRVDHIKDHFKVPGTYRKRAEAAVADVQSFKELAEQHDPLHVLIYIGVLPDERQDAAALKRFLLKHPPPEDGEVFYTTQWYKAVCLYDWLQFAKRAKAPPKRRTRSSGR
jgi:hypothetical protein